MDVNTTVGNVGLGAAFFAGLAMFSLVFISKEAREKTSKLRSTLSCKRRPASVGTDTPVPDDGRQELRRSKTAHGRSSTEAKPERDPLPGGPTDYSTSELVVTCFTAAKGAGGLNLAKTLSGLLPNVTDGFCSPQRKYDIALAMAFHAIPVGTASADSRYSSADSQLTEDENNDSAASQRSFTTLISPDALLLELELIEQKEKKKGGVE